MPADQNQLPTAQSEKESPKLHPQPSLHSFNLAYRYHLSFPSLALLVRPLGVPIPQNLQSPVNRRTTHRPRWLAKIKMDTRNKYVLCRTPCSVLGCGYPVSTGIEICATNYLSPLTKFGFNALVLHPENLHNHVCTCAQVLTLYTIYIMSAGKLTFGRLT